MALFLAHCGSNSSSIDGVKKDASVAPPVIPPTSAATPAPIAGPTSAPTVTPSTTTLTDIKKIMSYGPGISFNQFTGNSSDMSLNPVTRLPAVTYIDKSSPISGTTTLGGLKYAWMDVNGGWNVEVIDANTGSAACGTVNATCVGAANALASGANIANIVAIGFKSTGLPVVVYVYGASTTAAKLVKFAERDASGNWNLSIVSYSGYGNVNITNDPIKSLTLVMDSSDRPHVTFAFYHSTITSSQLVYAFRDSTLTWNSYNEVPIWTAGTVALGTGMNSSNSVFCPVDGSFLTTSTISTGIGTATSNIHKCLPGANGGCNGAGWTTLAMTAPLTLSANPASLAAGIGGGRTAVNINSANKIIISSVDAATGIKFAVSTQTCDTALASLLWTAAGTQIATANAGINGYKTIMTSNKIIAFYGIASTSVAFAKSADDFSAGAFNATDRITPETVVTGNDGVSAVYDSTNDTVYGSYGAIPAGAAGAIGNDLRIAFGAPADILSTVAQMTISNIDQTNRFFANTSIPNVSASKAANGTIGYSYFFQDNGATPGLTSKLYYGVKTGTASAPLFTSNLVYNHLDTATVNYVGNYSSLAYDSNSNPVIAYLDGTGGFGNLIVSRSTNQGLSFASDYIDGTSSATITVGQYPSASVFGSTVGVAYYDFTAGAMGLKFARYKPGTGWAKFAVDAKAGVTGTGCLSNPGTYDAGKYAVMKWTSTGRPVILYQGNPVSQKNLRIAYGLEAPTSATYTWTCLTLDSSLTNTRGEGLDMVLDANDKPHIVHYDQTQGSVRYVTCGNNISTCVATGASAFTSERISLTSSVTSGGSKPTIQVTSAGKRYVAFHMVSDFALALGSKGPTDTSWNVEFLDVPAVTGGGFSSLAGMNAAMVLNSFDMPVVFYRSLENWLKYFSREYF